MVARTDDGERWLLLSDGTYYRLTEEGRCADDGRWVFLPDGTFRQTTLAERFGRGLPEGARVVGEPWLRLGNGETRAMTEEEQSGARPLPRGAEVVPPPP